MSSQLCVTRIALLAKKTSPSGNKKAVSEARWVLLLRDCNISETTTAKGKKGIREVEGGGSDQREREREGR